MAPTRYESIGAGYATSRREDPHLAARIADALGDARTVVNVGAGAGSYEPADRWVLAVEPSDVMAAQRPAAGAPSIRAFADALPLRDRAVDAAMAVLTVHHWDAGRERERVLDPAARAATSGFARMDAAVVERAVEQLRRDLRSGAWDARHGELRTRPSLDVGLRLVVAR